MSNRTSRTPELRRCPCGCVAMATRVDAQTLLRLEYLAGALSGAGAAWPTFARLERQRRQLLASVHLGVAEGLTPTELRESEQAVLDSASEWSLLAQIAVLLNVPGTVAITARMIDGFGGALEALASSGAEDDAQWPVSALLAEGRLGLLRVGLKAPIGERVEAVAELIEEMIAAPSMTLLEKASELWTEARLLSFLWQLVAPGRGYPIGSPASCGLLSETLGSLFALSPVDAAGSDSAPVLDVAQALYVEALELGARSSPTSVGVAHVRAAVFEAKVVVLFQAQLGSHVREDELARVDAVIDAVEAERRAHLDRMLRSRRKFGALQQAALEQDTNYSPAPFERPELTAVLALDEAQIPTIQEPPPYSELWQLLCELALASDQTDRFLAIEASHPGVIEDELCLRIEQAFHGDRLLVRRHLAVLRQLAMEPGDPLAIPVAWEWFTYRPRAIKLARRRLLASTLVELFDLCQPQMRREGVAVALIFDLSMVLVRPSLTTPLMSQELLDLCASISVHARNAAFYAGRNTIGEGGHVTAIWREIGHLRALGAEARAQLPPSVTIAYRDLERAAAQLGRFAVRPQIIRERSNALALACEDLERAVDEAVE